MNAKTGQGQTALHLAVHQGHARIVERLVGFGVDLNIQDGDGDTALHIAVLKETVDNLTAETPQLKKVGVISLQSDRCSIDLGLCDTQFNHHRRVWFILVVPLARLIRQTFDE